MTYPAIHSELEVINKVLEGNENVEVIPYANQKATHSEFHKFIQKVGTPNFTYVTAWRKRKVGF